MFISSIFKERLGKVAFIFLAITGSILFSSPKTVQAVPPPSAFVTTWQTNNPGTSDDDQITIPTSNDFDYDYDVDWGDGSSSTDLTDDATHTYTTPGTYQIQITGTFPGIFFVLAGDREKLLSVDQWGDIVWSTMSGSFFGCTHLTIAATDTPDLSNVLDMTYAFRASGITDEDLSGWDVSHVIAAIGLFQDTSFNGDVTTWDLSSMINPSAMFYEDPAFNQDIGGWDLSAATTLNAMFHGDTDFNQDIGDWDVGNVTDMAEMFLNATSFDQDLENWDVQNVTTMEGMFEGTGLSNEHYDALLAGWSEEDLQPGVAFSAGSSSYCNTAAHDVLTEAPNNWEITDSGNLCLTEVTPIPSRVTMEDAVYYFAATEGIDDLFHAEAGFYESEEVDCTDCTVLINPTAHTVYFRGLQVGDTLDFSISFVDTVTTAEANFLRIGPFQVVDTNHRGSRRAKTGFSPEVSEEENDELPTTGTSPYDGSREEITPVEDGWFIRAEHYDTVYYLSSGHKRRPLLNEQIYFTWEDSFEAVHWVTDATLSSLEIGEPLLPNVGVVLVKVQSDARVYALGEDSVLRSLPDEQRAQSLYGSSWADYVIDLPPTLFEYFLAGEEMSPHETIDKTKMKKRSALTE